ncbi:MAG: DUF3352 domain-containing protein, partial [Cyanobacteria bacterium P01_D01_bin.2]
LLVTVGTAVFLVLGGAAAYLGVTQRLSARANIPAGMALVPKDALATLTLTTDQTQWTRLRQLGTPESQRVLDRLLVTWRDRIISANGYRFRTDIQPWIGDQVTVAFLPGAGQGEQVLLVPLSDPLQAQTRLSEPPDNVTWVGRDHQGVDIQSIKTAAGETFESAVLGSKWLVLASGASAIEAVVDSFDGGPSMLDSDAYRQATKRLPNAMAQLYVNVPAAADALARRDTVPGINGLVAAVTPLTNGLDMDVSTWLGPEDRPIYRDMVNAQSPMPERLPDSTVLMVSTGSIGPMWQALNGADRLTARLPFSAESLAKWLKTQTGLDMENDILPWLAGEVAFGLLPPTGEVTTESPSTMGQLALLAEVADRDAAEATWAQLEETMQNRFSFEARPQSPSVNQLVSYHGGIAMGYGWLEDSVTFFGLGPDVVGAIAPRPSKTLQTNRAFQTLLGTSAAKNSGYLFIDISRLEELQGILPFPTLPEGPLFSAIQSIGVSTHVEDERRLGYDIFIELPKGRRVKPLPEPDIPSKNQPPENQENIAE